MRPVDQRNQTYNKAMKVAKRIAITILCCLPFLVVFAYLTRNVITSNFWQIFIFIAVMAVAVLIEELIARAKQKRKQAEEMLSTKKDVFK